MAMDVSGGPGGTGRRLNRHCAYERLVGSAAGEGASMTAASMKARGAPITVRVRGGEVADPTGRRGYTKGPSRFSMTPSDMRPRRGTRCRPAAGAGVSARVRVRLPLPRTGGCSGVNRGGTWGPGSVRGAPARAHSTGLRAWGAADNLRGRPPLPGTSEALRKKWWEGPLAVWLPDDAGDP